jgi:glycosyltransferase involved in cell wall biosynthesis
VRIALIGPTHPFKGGIAGHTTALARRLDDSGHQVVLVSWRAQYPGWLYPGKQWLDIPESEPYPRTVRVASWYRPDLWPGLGYRAGRGDLVVFAVASPVQVPAYLAMTWGIGRRARVVALCHNVLPHESRPGDTVLMRALLHRMDGVLVHSERQRSLASALLGGARVPVSAAALPPHLPTSVSAAPALHRSAPAKADVPTAPARHLLFLGIVRPYKGVDVLLRALAAGPEGVTLTVAGEFWGGAAPRLRRLAVELGVADRVEFREGYVPAGRLPALFDAADALVLPYRSATASQNVWLAHTHRRPVIATRVGSFPEQVRDGVDGLLCRADDAADLARALHRFYTPGTPQRLRRGIEEVPTQELWEEYLEALMEPAKG